MHHTGRVVSRSEIVEHLYDQDFDRDSNTIEVFVGRLRKKLGADVLHTVRGLGYVMDAGRRPGRDAETGADVRGMFSAPSRRGCSGRRCSPAWWCSRSPAWR